MKKQFFFMLVCLSLTLNTFAFSGTGNGTEDDPFVITTPAELNEVRDNLTAHYQLGADIDLSDWIASNSPTYGWEPIGFTGTNEVTAVATFEGSLDGAGHVISGLWINRPSNKFVGLFGQVTGTVSFRNLGVIIAEGKSVTGMENVGGIAGWLTNITGKDPHRTTVSNCFVSGNIVGEKAVGGIIGLANWNHPIVENCYSTGLISSAETLGDGLGGLIGSSWGNVETNLTHSYSVASLVSTAASGSAAGLMGSASASNADGIVLNIANNVAVNPTIDAQNPKRIIGYTKSGAHLNLSNYAYVGVLLNGLDEWLGYIDNDGGQDVSATDLSSVDFYTDLSWDMQDVWQLGNGTYQLPVLKGLPLDKQPLTALDHLPAGNTIINATVESFKVVCHDGQLSFQNAPADASIRVYDFAGRLVAEGTNVSSLNKGVYVVKANHLSAKFIK
ncbi:MAG: T9SS type A sorting domain-containing protein [Candidatus Symbiothrix sp.]|jgi:hypothetical protein|nr:T9SS type A sorting domain-containing protein [Candidatus Symbiothrix sp.]